MSEKRNQEAWVKGSGICGEAPAGNAEKAYRLVLLGAPGIGKGTQAELLHDRLSACHLSTGEIFRAAKRIEPEQLSPAMRIAVEYMLRGDLVPDATVLDMVRERLTCLRCPGGFLLDGFPRTVPQAEALDNLLMAEDLALSAVLNYELPIEQIVARLSGRRTCPKCKAVYHVDHRPPKREGICDNCGGTLVIREDDGAEAVRVRMASYVRNTTPLSEYYRKLGLLISVSADGSPEEIYQRAMSALDGRV